MIGEEISYAGIISTPTLDVLLDVQVEITTQTWNRAGGRIRTGRAYLEWNPPVPDALLDTLTGKTRPVAHAWTGFHIDDRGKPAVMRTSKEEAIKIMLALQQGL